MAWFKINGQKLTAIADAIRLYTGSEATMGLDAMAAKVESVHTSGYNSGWDQGMQDGQALGRQEGYADGKAAGIEEGKQAEYDAFWDAYQENGTRGKYEYAFCGQGWTDKTFKPKHNIVLGFGFTGTYMFWCCKVSNLAEALEKQGVVLDTTLCGNAQMMFQGAETTRIPELNFSHAQDYCDYGLYMTFINATVKTIDKLIVPDKLKYENTFNGCSNLENITFEGVIGNSLSFANSSKLTNASVQSIIDHLKDLTNQTPQTLTLHETVKANLTEEQLATITGKNWSVA